MATMPPSAAQRASKTNEAQNNNTQDRIGIVYPGGGGPPLPYLAAIHHLSEHRTATSVEATRLQARLQVPILVELILNKATEDSGTIHSRESKRTTKRTQ